MKKILIAVSLCLVMASASAEIVTPIEPKFKITYLGELYTVICAALTGSKGNYHAPDKAYPQAWHCFKDGR